MVVAFQAGVFSRNVFEVWGLGLRVQGQGFRVQGQGCGMVLVCGQPSVVTLSTQNRCLCAFITGAFVRSDRMNSLCSTQVLVCATIVSVVVSGCAHPFLGGIYARVRPFLSFMDRTAAKEQDREVPQTHNPQPPTPHHPLKLAPEQSRIPLEHHVVTETRIPTPTEPPNPGYSQSPRTRAPKLHTVAHAV